MTARILRASYQLRYLIGLGAFVGGCFLLERVALPLQRRFGAGREAPDLRAQRGVHRGCRGYLRFLVALGAMRLEIRGAERLRGDGPRLVVANHPSLLDFVVLSSLMPQADCIVSRAWTDRSPLRGIANAAAYVRDDDPAQLVRECVGRLRRGRSVVVFPEGTRSPAYGLGPFQRGAARIAREADCELQPVLIHWDPPWMYKGWGLGDLPARPIHATVRALQAIPPKPLERGDPGVSTSVASRRLMAELRDLFLEELDVRDA